MRKNTFFTVSILITVFCSTGFRQAPSIYQALHGTVTFRSEAPLELIKASSNELVCLIDNDKKTFAFKINIRSFNGFNSPLQKEHFNQNYLESEKYPEASFKGKIIEDEDLGADGVYQVRAKGQLTIHGITQERIIKSTVTVNNRKIILKSNFTILLSNYNILIPRVVYQKLADEIKIEVNAILETR